MEKVRLCGVSVLVGGSVRVTWVDGADDGESQGDHEGAGGAVPLGVEDGEVGDLGCGVRGDRIQSGLCPQGAEGGVHAPGGEAPDPGDRRSTTRRLSRHWRSAGRW